MASKASSTLAPQAAANSDISEQITTNAEVIFPRDKDLKVITALSQSGTLYYSTLVASDPKSASAHKEYKTLVVGQGEKTRVEATNKLLEEIEKRVAKQVLKK